MRLPAVTVNEDNATSGYVTVGYDPNYGGSNLRIDTAGPGPAQAIIVHRGNIGSLIACLNALELLP